jgi:hypothetical protein
MTALASAVLAIFVLAAATNPDPEIPYFKQVREVSISAPDRQNYLVVDAAIWNYARPDLADLRLYDGANQVPYQLTSERAAASSQEVEAKILNLVQHGDHTEFDLDVAPLTEYNRIRLTLNRQDFLATASVAGRDELGGGSLSAWPTPSTIFDFSHENLGSNSNITLPTWSFRFVHIRLSPGILPKEVQRATVAYLREKKAFWTDAGTCRLNGEQKRSTVVTCDVPPAMPIDRIQFDVPATHVNFRRPVSVANEKGIQVAAGIISRIRMNRAGTTAVAEDLAVNVFGDYTARLTITIDNGDDPPIALDRIRPQSLERRLYFEPPAKANLKLYYGDENLASPVYDYAKFFREDPNAALAQLAPEMLNAAYTGRPDDRPWSERHKGILWVAMLLALAVLGMLAIRGLRTGAGTGN